VELDITGRGKGEEEDVMPYEREKGEELTGRWILKNSISELSSQGGIT